MKITARLLAMSDSEILGMVSPRTITDIKRTDPTPMFKVLCVGHEGEARPKVIGLGSTVQRWFQSAIEALTGRLPLGIPAFHDHASTNSGEGRRPIGEIVGKALRHIEGVLSSIAVAYIYPQYRDLPLDVASIEATIQIPKDTREFDVQDVDVSEVTGIALGNSAMNTPAFPGATLLAQLQAFAETNRQGGEKNMTLEEIKKVVQENKYAPSDLFPTQALIADPVVQERIEDMKDSVRSASIRKTRELEEKNQALEAEKKTLSDRLGEHEKTILKTRAQEQFEAVLKERPKLKEDERLSKYLRKQFDKGFTPTDEAKLKDDLNKFVDGHVTEYQELFGEPKPGDKGKEKPAGQQQTPAGNAPEGTTDADLEELKKSDLFPKD